MTARRGPDPHNLHRLAQNVAPIIEVDRKCAGCGYNLRGLRLGINCPECGMPSTRVAGSDDPLAEMPMRIILTLVRGCWVAAICVVLMVAAVLADRFRALDHAMAMVALAGLSIVWAGAVCWLTPAFNIPQAVSRGFSVRSRTRRFARWLQLGWVAATSAATALAFIAAPTPSVEGFLTLLMYGGLMVGLAGLVVLSLLMERLAEWARDEDAQRMFNWAMWSWPIAMLAYVPVRLFIGSWLSGTGQPRVGSGVFVLLWVAAVCTFPYGLMMLAKSVTLSILHNLEHRDRTQRKLERDQEHTERLGNRAARTEPQPMRNPPRQSRG